MTTKSEPEKKTPPEPGNQENPKRFVPLELEFNIVTNAIVMRCKAPTVVVSSILQKMLDERAHALPLEEKDETVIRIVAEEDLVNDTCTIKTNATPVMLRGVLVMAQSILTQSQVLQRVQAMQAQSRILGPGGQRVS